MNQTGLTKQYTTHIAWSGKQACNRMQCVLLGYVCCIYNFGAHRISSPKKGLGQCTAAILLFLAEMLAAGYTGWKSSCSGYSGQEDKWDPPSRTAFGGPRSLLWLMKQALWRVPYPTTLALDIHSHYFTKITSCFKAKSPVQALLTTVVMCLGCNVSMSTSSRYSASEP